MPLSPGAQLGSFQIIAPIGAGGMGEVYRARDRKLDRDVAIKILPEALAADPDRIARFEREAKILAALNHPNIAHIHGIEESDGRRALIMELVEGPTLADRIAQRAIPVDEALPIARQITDALEAAHEQGIIHRDLKPANIKVSDEGTVKVLDFGLAKALERVSVTSDVSASPTITSPAIMTGVGVMLGTAAYMSPEQARGKSVDRRTDIWAFGCVFYEMLTGRRAFEGEDVSLTLSQILQRDPRLDLLPADTPARVRQTIDLCLRKTLKERMPDIAGARFMLDGAFQTIAAQATGTTPPRTWPRAIPMFLAAIAAAVVAGLGVWQVTRSRGSEPHNVVRFAMPASASIAPRGAGVGRHVLAISPQGTHLVYWADSRLHLRALDRLDDDVTIRGTENAREPFFSPDGRWIGFHSEDRLMRTPVDSGAPIALGTAHNPWGVSWDTDGVIRYGEGPEGIWQVSPTGGAPARLLAVGKGELAHGPQLLPGGDWVLFTLRPSSEDSWDRAQIIAQSVTSGERIVLIERGRDARYLPTGHLVYGLNGALLGVPFDARARRVTGPAVPLVEGVMDADVRTGAMHFAVSNDGTLVYLSGSSGARSTLSWLHRDGRHETLRSEALPYSHPRLSPDGTRAAVEIASRDGTDIHIFDLARESLTRLTSSPSHGRSPLWTPDSQHIVFYSDAGGGGLYSMSADGTGTPRRLTTTQAIQTPNSWANGGRTLLFEQRPLDRIRSADIYALSLDGEPIATPLVQTPADETAPAVSPDGRWLAYAAGDTDGVGVYVRPFPNVDGGRWPISTDGGHSPVWSRDGRQLFFISQGRAMSVPIETAASFHPGTAKVMFDLPPYYQSALAKGREWDIASDGERFLIVNPGATATSEQSQRIVVVLNWTEELKRLVPTK